MSFFQRFSDFLKAHSAQGTGLASAPPSPTVPAGTQQTQANQPAQPTSKSASKNAVGHIKREKLSFKQVGPNDVISESEEHWQRNGGVNEGNTLKTRAITASGQVADASDLQSICTICNRLENIVIRSEISHVTLCQVCQRIFEKPNGEKVVVTPAEFEVLKVNFNTWERFDARRKESGHDS